MISKDEFIDLIIYKLKFNGENDTSSYGQTWDLIRKNPVYASLVKELAPKLFSTFKKSNQYLIEHYSERFTIDPAKTMLSIFYMGQEEKIDITNTYIEHFRSWLMEKDGEQLNRLMETVAKIAGEHLDHKVPETAIDDHSAGSIQVAVNEIVQESESESAETTIPITFAEDLQESIQVDAQQSAASEAVEGAASTAVKQLDTAAGDEQSCEAENLEAAHVEASIVKLPSWNNEPIAPGPDLHDEFYSKSLKVSLDMDITGARVRGKKHKHDGTNCDDWFEAGTSGAWSIIAVSDGAGSKKFSRVGSKETCGAAYAYLKEALATHQIKVRDEWKNETFVRDLETGSFIEEDLEYVQQALHKALHQAYEAMEQAVQKRNSGEYADSYQQLLGRELSMQDLSATMLLTVHSVIKVNGQDYSFILSSQIGDGSCCVIRRNESVCVLGVPDSGEFSGETEFLTSKKFLDKSYMWRKTYPFFGPIKALMVMTDGVADDYFPADPQMKRLYDDLVTNQIIMPTNQPESASAHENLRNWLDTYQVRGSFDDRTLVILSRGETREPVKDSNIG